jgi:hypothetical protein
MKTICAKCGKMGYTQIRKDYVRIAHYIGYEDNKRLIEWHSSTLDETQKVNPEIDIAELINNGVSKSVINGVINSSGLFFIRQKKPDENVLNLVRKTHNLECKRGHRPMPRSRGLESRPRHHFYFSIIKRIP